MQRVKSCGFLIFRREPELSFLLMCLPGRYDLPKGHVDGNETELECAWRELMEETGMTSDEVRIQEGFRFETTYYPRYRRYGSRIVEKKVVIFLAWLEQPCEIRLTEHQGFEWIRWTPPHSYRSGTIDQVLAAAERFFSDSKEMLMKQD